MKRELRCESVSRFKYILTNVENCKKIIPNTPKWLSQVAKVKKFKIRCFAWYNVNNK
jgi:hypothetical protein